MRVFDGVAERAGRIDILVNAAGGQLRQPALEITEEEWNRLLAVNLTGAFFAPSRGVTCHKYIRG